MDGRGRALAKVCVAYAVALVAAIVSVAVVARVSEASVLVQIVVADLVATVVVFGFSVRYDNSSVYDAYWSVLPIWLVSYLGWLGWQAGVAPPARIVLVVAVVWFWGLRLTHNWARGWSGFDHEDWRYRVFRANTGALYWLVSLLGIHLFPTALVLLGCLPIFAVMLEPGRPLGWVDGLATLVTCGAVVVELVADNQLRDYVLHRRRPGETMTEGLWGYSRHPNYFGELCFWWGIWLFGVAAVGWGSWVMVSGAVGMTLLFNLISVPLIERRMLARREDYARVQARISRIVPWFPRRG